MSDWLPTPMILAAGHATRLRPLTSNQAKAVVPFLNRPLLDHTLDWLSRSGFTRVVVNLHHAPETIASLYGSQAFGLRIDYSYEPELLGTAGGPRAALDRLGDRVLLVNGDVVGLMSLGPLLAHHQDSGALATLALYQGEAGRTYPQVRALPSGELAAFPGQQAGPEASVAGVFTGLHVVERAVLEMVPEGTAAGIVDSLYGPMLAEGHALHAVTVPGAWYEVGDLSRYIDNQLRSLELADAPLGVRDCQRVVTGGYRSRDSHIENVRLVAPYLTSPGVRLRHGASLTAVVLGDRTRVGAGASLERVVTWQDSWIGPRCKLRNVVVMSGVRVPPGTELDNAVVTPTGVETFTPPVLVEA